jgi:hypothetical protein
VATKRLTDAEKAARAAARLAAKATQAGDKDVQQQAAAALQGATPAQVGAEAPSEVKTSGRTYFVACRHLGGLIIQSYAPMKEMEPVIGGGQREVTRYRTTGAQFKLNGPLRALKEMNPHAIGMTGYAMTEGVPADLWEEWMRHNAESALVKNHMVFGHERRDAVEGWAREHKGVVHNFEPVNVSLVGNRIQDPRARRTAQNVTDGKIEIGATS